MAKSKKPRKAYRPPNFSRESQEQAWATYADNVHVDKDPPAPAHTHVTSPSEPASPRAPRPRGRYLVPVAAGAGVVGGATYLAHRARRRKAEMAKGLTNPVTGESVSYSKVYIDDVVDKADEKPRGVLVAKAGIPKRAALLMRAGQGATVAGRGARSAGRGVRAVARQPKEFGAGFLDTIDEGSMARGRHAVQEGRMGTARRAGAVTSAMGGGTLLAFGGGHFVGRHDEMGNKRMGPADRKKARAKANTSKRYDETALEHHGSRRGGRTPVSSVRVSGLPVQSASFSRGDAEARPGPRSHANKATHVHTKVKANRTGKLYVLRHHPRRVGGSTVGKSAGFAQSGGAGRRLTNV